MPQDQQATLDKGIYTVFATYSSEGKMPIHARFAISELLYNY